MADFPRRIICLTEETTETLYLLGEGDRVVGISGYTVRPPEARLKPKVSAFINAKFDKILALEPDLVLTFSDLQADIARELIRRGVTVLAFNQRSVAEILNMILTLSSVVGVPEKGLKLVGEMEAGLQEIQKSAGKFMVRPRVFFEEWNDPLISGIRWVEELIEIAGGEPIFPELRFRKNAPDRIVDPASVIPKNPDVIIGSWCGVKVNKATIRSRAGRDAIAAVRNNRIYEIKSPYILQLCKRFRTFKALKVSLRACPLLSQGNNILDSFAPKGSPPRLGGVDTTTKELLRDSASLGGADGEVG